MPKPKFDYSLNYAELEERSARLATWLHRQGLRRGDSVALLATNSLEHYVVYWAAMRSGLYLTAINFHLLPAEVPFDDAAYTVARAALLTKALVDPSYLFSATEDRLHQPHRREVLGASLAVVDQLRARGLPAVISGAGPTVLVLGEVDRVTTAALRSQHWRVWPTAVDRAGATVRAAS